MAGLVLVLTVGCATAPQGARRLPATPAPEPVISTGGGLAVTAPGFGVRVRGNRLVDLAGREVRLLGANRSGTQYACAEGDGIFDGPVDDRAIAVMASWKMTAVRVSLNENCWLGINGVRPAYAGSRYRAAIVAFVRRLNARRLYVVLDLHWSAPGRTKALDQTVMPDRDHAPAFWRSVAATFARNPAVVFDLFNEPFPDHNHNTTAAWTCVRNGGRCPGVGFAAAGMTELLRQVRAVHATNVVLVGGPQYAGMVDRWRQFAPADPARQLAASIHIYLPHYSPCDSLACWNRTVAPLAARVPVVIGEFGAKDCTGAAVTALMRWADAHHVSYLAWAWFTGSCAGEPALISSYNGTPTRYGAAVRDHLRALARGH
ncbi:MAG: hypothetical protein JWN55_2341 [Frankiales bacterium]|nr:hypothetical protein [Frankiales bacterium]